MKNMTGLECENLLKQLSKRDSEFNNIAQYFNDNDLADIKNNIVSAIDYFLNSQRSEKVSDEDLKYLNSIKDLEISDETQVESIMNKLESIV